MLHFCFMRANFSWLCILWNVAFSLVSFLHLISFVTDETESLTFVWLMIRATTLIENVIPWIHLVWLMNQPHMWSQSCCLIELEIHLMSTLFLNVCQLEIRFVRYWFGFEVFLKNHTLCFGLETKMMMRKTV